MPKLIFDRRFIVAYYTVHHGLLLFRSGKSSVHPTRVDVLFRDVMALESRCVVDGLTVEEADRAYLEALRSRPEAIMEPGHKIYTLTSKDSVGFVIAGPTVQWHEDDRNIFDASHLLHDYDYYRETDPSTGRDAASGLP